MPQHWRPCWRQRAADAPRPQPERRLPASAIPRLTALAHHAATINGDPSPAWIAAVLTTRAKALTSATPGDYVPGSGHVKVFLITMHGHFTARGAPGPPGAKPPAGRYLLAGYRRQDLPGP